jgi:hypothetical protein
MCRIILLTLLPVFFAACTEKQSMEPDKVRIVNLCESFMQNFRDTKLLAAMDILKNNSIISSESIESLYNQIISQEGIFRRYGNALSHDFIEEKRVTDFLAKRYYVLRFENYYSIFQFTIYKTNKGWRITHFKFDDELGEVLK